MPENNTYFANKLRLQTPVPTYVLRINILRTKSVRSSKTEISFSIVNINSERTSVDKLASHKRPVRCCKTVQRRWSRCPTANSDERAEWAIKDDALQCRAPGYWWFSAPKIIQNANPLSAITFLSRSRKLIFWFNLYTRSLGKLRGQFQLSYFASRVIGIEYLIDIQKLLVFVLWYWFSASIKKCLDLLGSIVLSYRFVFLTAP